MDVKLYKKKLKLKLKLKLALLGLEPRTLLSWNAECYQLHHRAEKKIRTYHFNLLKCLCGLKIEIIKIKQESKYIQDQERLET
jgi:hypothetical protein